MRINKLSFSNTKPENMYLYNNKELTSYFGLDWYEYGARMYDAEIARFPSLDPKADEFAFVSPYNYAENRPIDGIDLWGLQWCPTRDWITDGYYHTGYKTDQVQIFNKFRAKSDLVATAVAVGGVATEIAIFTGATTSEMFTNQVVVKGLTGAVVDFGSQMTTNGGQISDWNITQTVVSGTASTLNIPNFKTLFTISAISATTSSAFEVNPSQANTIFNGKPIKEIAIQSAIGTVSNILGGLSKRGNNTSEAISNQIPNFLLNIPSNIIQNNLSLKKKKR